MENANAKDYSFAFDGDNGQVILLIHGITGTPAEMRYIGKGFNKAGFSVFCNTLPHHCDTLKELKKVTWEEIFTACRDDLKKLKNQYQKVYVGGLSMGALIGIHLARQFPSEVSGIIALAPTLFYDGWAVHKGQILLYLVWQVPFLRNAINIRESWPYGVKDEYIREKMGGFYKNANAAGFDQKVLMFGSPFFPVASLYQLHKLAKVVIKELPSVTVPILIIHAKEDDMTSPRNAEYIYHNIASLRKSLVLLDDSYHMITIDKQKDKVIEETVKFLNQL